MPASPTNSTEYRLKEKKFLTEREIPKGGNMKLTRREFVELAGASVVSMSLAPSARAGSPANQAEAVEKNGWRLQVAPSGNIDSLTDGKLELVNPRLGDNHPRIFILPGGRFLGLFAMKLFVCNQPTAMHREGSAVTIKYQFSESPALAVEYRIELLDLIDGAVALRQKVGIDAASKLSENVMLQLPRNIQLPFENRQVFLPLKNGVGRRKAVAGLDNDDEYVFRFAGNYEGFGKPQPLGIPLVDEYADKTDLHLTFCTDPFFTSHFSLPYGGKAGQFHCVYTGGIGAEGREERSIYTCLHRGDADAAMKVFYKTSVADVKAGPEWLHEIAMVDYDYFSKNGQGWFADIDKLSQIVGKEDRHKVLLALICFDYIGRYTYNVSTHSLDRRWTVSPNARDPEVQALGDVLVTGDPMRWDKKSLQAMRPVQASIDEVHHRIRYAKDRGFRVVLYYADGMAACDGIKEIYDPSKVLMWGGWRGPEIGGRTYQQNPLHPGVRDFYKEYMRALIAEYGKEVDGYVWDETFTVNTGAMGTEAYPGYADRAFMTLVKEVAALVADANPEAALLASDDLGLAVLPAGAAPFCLVAHGTYQDSHCRPEAWPYGLFPNYRNTLWSCNWAPVTRFPFTEYAVETFDVPVAISNGPFGESIGVSDMTSQQLEKVVALFEKRKHRKMQITWIEENGGNPTYQGRPVKYKYSLW
jgi:hypothetical protein